MSLLLLFNDHTAVVGVSAGARTSARIGHGSLFTVGNGGAPETFVTVAEVTSIAAPSIQKQLVDVSHMGSPALWREFRAALRDGGEAKLDMNFVPGGPGQDLLVDLQSLSDPSNMRIRWPNGIYWSFKAWCTAFEPEAPVDDIMKATASFKVTGPVEFNAMVGTFYLTLGPDYLTLGADRLTLGM